MIITRVNNIEINRLKKFMPQASRFIDYVNTTMQT